MNPAFSVILFTTISGAAQGLIVVMALARLFNVPISEPFENAGLMAAFFMLIGSLGASFLHLGRPERAWRAVAMWRTSWLSREVIVLPLFIGVVGVWCFIGKSAHIVLPMLAIVLAALLWYCTGMIYACIKFIQEWAHPLTLINYTLIGLSSGVLLANLIAVLARDGLLAQRLLPWSALLLLAAALGRWASLRRNARLKPKSSAQSATGIKNAKLVQKSMGMTGGAFNTREFFHGAKHATMRNVKTVSMLLGFILPFALVCLAYLTGAGAWVLIAFVAHALGVVAERWLFFAQARHPQNLYYQTVS
jgi:sulfite dehydrogenase (quinone) subunit SoeC